MLVAIMQRSDFGVKDYGDLSLNCVPAQTVSQARGMKCRKGEEVMHMFGARPSKSLGEVFFII